MTDTNKRAVILQTAENLINGDRARTYGPPEESFGRIAELWSGMGFRIYTEDKVHNTFNWRPLTAVDAALAMAAMKLSRIISSPLGEDSYVDAAGYIALAAEMATRDVPEPEPKVVIEPASYLDVADWLENGGGAGTGNKLIADRIRERFGKARS